ncbi:MAG: carboxypeptidase regulatory-like domain-containing protein, partial [ANME-2 cluster archaeon]
HYKFTITNPYADTVELRNPDWLFSPTWGVACPFCTPEGAVQSILDYTQSPSSILLSFGITVFNGTFDDYDNRIEHIKLLERDEQTELYINAYSFFLNFLPTSYDGTINFDTKWEGEEEFKMQKIPVHVFDIGYVVKGMLEIISFSDDYFENIRKTTDTIKSPGISTPSPKPIDSYSPENGPKIIEYTEARIKIQLSQELTLEREAFKASTDLTNKLDSQFEDILVVLNVKDEFGENANNKFFIQPPVLSNINSITGNGIINSLSTSSINWLIIPTIGSGGDQDSGLNYTIQLNISGTVNGVPFTANSEKVKINVKPQPKLNLTYYLPTDIVADQPFHLAVKVNNSGYGKARNLRIESAQPEFVDNNAGLLLNFSISSSLLADFGDIAPGEEKIKYWTFMSSSSGRVSNFSASFTHSEILGGKATSIIQQVNTELLDRELSINGMEIPYIFDSDDDNKLDTIMDLPSKQKFSVEEADITNTQTDISNLTQHVLISKSQNKWVIIEIPDIFNGLRTLKRIYRSDGLILDSKNYWIKDEKIIIVDDPDTNYTILYSGAVNIPGIHGTVLDNNTMTGIAGAIVTTNTGNSTITNESGYYSMDLVVGTYDLNVTSDFTYYPNSSVTVEVPPGTTVNQDIKLEKKPTGTISGAVTSS